MNAKRKITSIILLVWVLAGVGYILNMLHNTFGRVSIEIIMTLISLLGIMIGYFYIGYIIAKEEDEEKEIIQKVSENGTGM